MLAINLSNYILKNSGKRLSNLELQKYLYLIEIEYIKNFNKHLIDFNTKVFKHNKFNTKVFKHNKFNPTG